ncbi:DUF1684 domain-containing protein [Streptomyces hoynatensis]|uniref:DUF1684 domain-containing protein n=1 Tax=Streptomyces hoynatensis TaxID=1141874 RepID=A0A3A9Z986_9ACTN|nr:DUF1684 domain-containing protein [Streptomyces hoynatensis]RKN44855.1 DUF1684 domain-containing protein [Streptomyces hoynatensis]
MKKEPEVKDAQRFAESWARWHAERERALAAPHGFLAITSLRWLSPEPTRFEDAPGTWSNTAEGPAVELAADEELTVDGATLRGRHVFTGLAERAGVFATYGDRAVEIARRGGEVILRPRDPGHRLRTAHAETPAYAPDPRWVLPGRYLPFKAPRAVTVGSVAEGLEHVYEAPGQVEFAWAGTTHRLTAFPGGHGGLLILFTDATSGVTTYAANRSLSVERPGEQGLVTLDFNRAVNLPCAYTDFATCPLPPAENRLPVAVEAGEKLPRERGGAA